MLTTIEVAQELGLNPSRIRQLVRAGIMPAVQRGGTYFFTRDTIEQARNRKQKPGPKPKQQKWQHGKFVLDK